MEAVYQMQSTSKSVPSIWWKSDVFTKKQRVEWEANIRKAFHGEDWQLSLIEHKSKNI